MGVTFFESMSGELRDTAGRFRHVAVDLRCDTTSLTGMLIDGLTRAEGTVRALPDADAAACSGTVLVRPLLGSHITYDLAFTGGDGAAWRLRGRKDVDLLRHPRRSLTTMRTTLSREGETVAEGTMQFFLNDLPAFLRSWRPRAAVARASDVGGRTGTAAPVLTAAERVTLQAYAEAVVPAYGIVPAADATTVAAAEEMLAALVPAVRSGFRAGLATLDVAARARYGRPFAALPVGRRRTVLDLFETLVPVGGPAARFALAIPVKMAHFSRRDYLDAAGQPTYDNPVAEPRPRWMAGVSAPEELPRDSTVECDVVVVGTGAGGAAAAADLAERGFAVLMVEEGRYEGRQEFAGGPDRRLLRFLRDGGLTVTLGNGSVAVPTARMVGGSTAVNAGTCFRTPDAVLAEWREAGLPADFEPAAFGRWLDRVEAELQVAPTDARYLGRIADVVARGVEAMGGTHGPLDRNAPGCDGQGLCFVGCPTDARRSANVSWVPRALRAGAQLVTGLAVRRLLLSGSAGARRAVGVVAEGQDRCGAPHRVEVRARAVVLAAGTLQTPVLLRTNGIDLPWLGRNLSIHPATGAYALMPDEAGEGVVAPWRAVPQGYGAEGLRDPLVRFEGCYMLPSIAMVPLEGEELSRWMDAWARVEQYGFMVRDTGVGSVLAGPTGRPVVRYPVTPRVLAAFHAGTADLAEMLLRGGASEVATAVEGVGTVRTVAQARAVAGRSLPARAFRSMGFHPLGTARMGTSPDTAVVDFDHRVFGTSGLYVADGSCVPTSLGVNPQVTIMAMGLRAADAVARELGARDAVSAETAGAYEAVLV